MTEIKEIKVTPCCKTRHWHFVNRVGLPTGGVIRCEFCDREVDYETLEVVTNSLNPTTFFCDKCYRSAENELNSDEKTLKNQIEQESNSSLLNKLEEDVEKLKKEAMCNVDFDENCYNFAIDDIKSIIAKHKLLALSGSWSDESAEGVKREIAKLKRGGE
jgi:hypothetical protein